MVDFAGLMNLNKVQSDNAVHTSGHSNILNNKLTHHFYAVKMVIGLMLQKKSEEEEHLIIFTGLTFISNASHKKLVLTLLCYGSLKSLRLEHCKTICDIRILMRKLLP